MRQARIGSIAGQSAQPTAPLKLRGLPRTGFAATKLTHAQRTVNFGSAPTAVAVFIVFIRNPTRRRWQTSGLANLGDSQMADPHNRIAIVTGAGSGIGKASAIRLLEDGWCVVFTGRRLEALREAIAAAGDPYGDIDQRALAVPADMTQADSVAALFDVVRTRFGRLDLVFNNAGTGAPPVLLEDLSVEQWRSVVDTNLTGVFLCIQQAFRIMKAQSPMGGRIINNGSISAYAPRPNSAPYTATKHAVSGLTRAASLDGRKYDIAVGQIDIGNAATDMTQRMTGGVPQADGSMKAEDRMDVRHVADSVLHMANLPLSANVLFMNVMATKMPFVGRG
jgi:NAD(P)-dependent dehydrogenase (short-subunit alcohol dehydrogenase family)